MRNYCIWENNKILRVPVVLEYFPSGILCTLCDCSQNQTRAWCIDIASIDTISTSQERPFDSKRFFNFYVYFHNGEMLLKLTHSIFLSPCVIARVALIRRLQLFITTEMNYPRVTTDLERQVAILIDQVGLKSMSDTLFAKSINRKWNEC